MNMNSNDASAEKCIPQETVLNNVMLAHAYVPFQKLCNTFTPAGSLIRGTAFPPLYNLYGWERKGIVVYDDE